MQVSCDSPIRRIWERGCPVRWRSITVVKVMFWLECMIYMHSSFFIENRISFLTGKHSGKSRLIFCCRSSFTRRLKPNKQKKHLPKTVDSIWLPGVCFSWFAVIWLIACRFWQLLVQFQPSEMPEQGEDKPRQNSYRLRSDQRCRQYSPIPWQFRSAVFWSVISCAPPRFRL